MLGKHELDELLSERERLNADIQRVLDSQTDAWGIKVSNVEIKDVDINETMIRAIARQAEAERERRAKVRAYRARARRCLTVGHRVGLERGLAGGLSPPMSWA